MADLHGNQIADESPSTAETAHEACGARRLRLSRKAGWRKPEGAVVVSRPGKFGNPFTLDWVRLDGVIRTDAEARVIAVKAFQAWLTDENYGVPFRSKWLDGRRAWILEHLNELAGRNLCCWCPMPEDGEDDWCHAAVLISLANGGER